MLRLKSIVVCFLLFFVYIISCEGIGSKCDVNTDCAGLTNTVCMNGVCACKRNYTEVNGQCVKGINASCTSISECTLPFTNCTQNQCVCQEGYVASSVNCCIPYRTVGEDCEFDEDCSNAVPHSVCGPDRFCICANGYDFNKRGCFKHKSLGMACKHDGECYVTYGKATCQNGYCTCEFGVQYGRNVCMKRGYKFTNQQLITNSGTNNVTVIETFINTLE